MATLPDLDTTSIGNIAYWNAIDQGQVTQIDPEEVLTDNAVGSYTIYDNGVEGDYTLLTGKSATFRVKNDGWMIVYTDRTNNYTVSATSPDGARGYWDLINDWTDTNGPADIQQNSLERGIRAMEQQLPNSDEIVYNSADVGIYNYEYTNADTITLLAHWISGGYEASSTTRTGGFAYTSGTTLDWMAASSACGQNSADADADLEGITIADTRDVSGDAFGAIDPIARGLVPSATTEYQLSSSRTRAYEASSGEFHSQLLTMWH